ncbi:MAG: hypothetical protein ACLFTI_08690 [Anaerolineales bacterium]
MNAGKARWLVLVGLIVGLAGGLVYAWVIAPPEYYDIYPPLMAAEHRRAWIEMTALAYGAEGNAERTQLRLRGLAEEEIRQVTARTLDAAAARGRPIATLRRLAELAQAYGADTPAVRIYADAEAPVTDDAPAPVASTATATSIPPTVTPTPLLPTPTLSPLPTPTPAPSPYRVLTPTITCTTQARISVALYISPTVAEDEDEDEMAPLPGEEIWLLGDEAADRAVTGMRPVLGLGYADFEVAPGQSYKVYVGSATGAPLVTLPVGPCPLGREVGWTSYHLRVLRLAPEPPPSGEEE